MLVDYQLLNQHVQAESQKLTYLKELGKDGEYKYVAKIDKNI